MEGRGPRDGAARGSASPETSSSTVNRRPALLPVVPTAADGTGPAGAALRREGPSGRLRGMGVRDRPVPATQSGAELGPGPLRQLRA